jgi:hypothetical protein
MRSNRVVGASVWLLVAKSQQSWVWSQHPPSQWNLRGDRWVVLKKVNKINLKKSPCLLEIKYFQGLVIRCHSFYLFFTLIEQTCYYLSHASPRSLFLPENFILIFGKTNFIENNFFPFCQVFNRLGWFSMTLAETLCWALANILKIFGFWKIEAKIAWQLMMTFVYRSNDIFVWHTNKANGTTGKN